MKKLIVIAGALFLFYSCENNDLIESNETTQSEYLPMSVGNYWVYEILQVDVDGTETLLSKLDSMTISKDTIIDGETYYRLDHYECQSYDTSYIDSFFYKDSVKHLISSEGRMLFAENNFTDTLFKYAHKRDLDTLYTVSGLMEKVDDGFIVPSGSFNEILNVKSTVNCNPDYTSIDNPRYTDKYYAKGIGVIFETETYFYSGYNFEKSLIRYNINE